MNNRTLLNGDCLDKLKEVDDNSIDLICTDPPYGYSFMNKDWDKAVISVDIWKECLRVLKHGSFAFVMSAPRQDVLSHMIVNLSEAGFKTDFTSIYWAYASGFPKAANISKLVDKRLGIERDVIGKSQSGCVTTSTSIYKQEGYAKNMSIEFDITKPTSDQAKKLNGSYAGFQPKPAVEVILVCMKPLSEKNYIDQSMKDGKGITWLDDCRVPYKDDSDKESSRWGNDNTIEKCYSGGLKSQGRKNTISNNQGRFPANLIISDNSLDIGKNTKSQRNMMKPDKGGTGHTLTFGDQTSEERGYNDSGDFSRYFSLDSWEAQFIITPKPSKSEKNEGLDSFLEHGNLPPYLSEFSKKLEPHKVNDGRKTEIDNPFQRGESIRQNTHPTVKPISLFKYLITMGSRPNDFVLDPFMGSGTTAIASEIISRNWIGIEMQKEYCDIISMRINKYLNQRIDEY